MRFFFSILSFAMLYMSCLPCGDSQECLVKTEAKISVPPEHEQHSHEAEACTPFCTCSCCPTSVVSGAFAKAQLEMLETPGHIKFPLFDISFQSEVVSHIWQPPKLS